MSPWTTIPETNSKDPSVLVCAQLENSRDLSNMYCYRIVTEGERTLFNALCYCSGRRINFSYVTVPNTAMEDIAEIARAADELCRGKMRG